MAEGAAAERKTQPFRRGFFSQVDGLGLTTRFQAAFCPDNLRRRKSSTAADDVRSVQ